MSAQKKSAAEEVVETRTTKILVVDDIEENVELLSAFLSSAGYEVLTAYDGNQALAQVGKEDPDLILLDIMMPKVDGFEVCRKLKVNEKTRLIPIIMVTAYDNIENIEKAVEVDTIYDFLVKPVNKLELLTRVKSLLRVRHLTKEIDRLLHYLSQIEQ